MEAPEGRLASETPGKAARYTLKAPPRTLAAFGSSLGGVGEGKSGDYLLLHFSTKFCTLPSMWPFRSKVSPEEPPPDKRSPNKRMDDLELELLELRDSQEKTLGAIKRIQGRLMKRVQVEEAEEASQEAAGEPNGVPQVPQHATKAQLYALGNRLRASR